ncbi:MAG TPA: glycosyltransferase family 2 protein [Syntrophorhabdaceae bacterium]|nr:glycosyltransferase family 2 protein [Syntrophorhabdaceae bacterium]
MDMKDNHGSQPVRQTSKAAGAKIPLSVYMITLNNGATIERALQSVAAWANEVVVVDSHSTDGAMDVIERYTDRIFQYDTTSQKDKYQYAQDQCRNRWVLFIDADEWLTGEFKEEVEKIISSGESRDGYIAHRRNVYLGREIRYGGWYPDREIRLYRKDKGSWQGGIHAKVHVNGRTGVMKNRYMHTPYTDTAHQIRTIDRYSAAFAEDLFQSQRHFDLFSMLTRPIFRFIRDYIFKKGFLDGIPGLIIAVSTMYYVFMKQAKLWEMEKRHGGNARIQK